MEGERTGNRQTGKEGCFLLLKPDPVLFAFSCDGGMPADNAPPSHFVNGMPRHNNLGLIPAFERLVISAASKGPGFGEDLPFKAAGIANALQTGSDWNRPVPVIPYTGNIEKVYIQHPGSVAIL